MKKFSRFIMAIVMTLSLVLLLNGCGDKKKEADTKPQEAAETSDTADQPAAEAPEIEEEQAEASPEDADIPDIDLSEDIEGFDNASDKEETDNSGNDTAWADAYHDYLIDFERMTDDNDYDGLEMRSYSLIYVNDDDIPELVMEGSSEAVGNLIITYNNGSVDELQTSRLYFDYIERGNLLRNSDGHMGGYYDYIYTIKDGRWETLEYGEYYVEDNSVMWDDDDLIYEWNGKKTDKEGYDKELNKVYDTKKAIPGGGLLDYEDILDKLENVSKGLDTESFLEDDKGIHKYDVFVGDVTFDEAMRYCRTMGGHLVRINSYEEQEHIEKILMDNDQEKLVLWIAGKRNPKDGHYHWFNGDSYSEIALDTDKYYDLFWLSGEPSFTGEDAEGKPVDEEYLCMFRVKGMWSWNDVPADITQFYKGKIGYICEYE